MTEISNFLTECIYYATTYAYTFIACTDCTFTTYIQLQQFPYHFRNHVGENPSSSTVLFVYSFKVATGECRHGHLHLFTLITALGGVHLHHKTRVLENNCSCPAFCVPHGWRWRSKIVSAKIWMLL